MLSLEEGGWQLVALKKMEKAVQEVLKVMIESWTPHAPRFNYLTFNSEVGYGWEEPGAWEVLYE